MSSLRTIHFCKIFGFFLLFTSVFNDANAGEQVDSAPKKLLQALNVSTGTVQQLDILPSPNGFRVSISLGGSFYILNLFPDDIRSSDFQLLIDDGESIRQLPTQPVVTFQGDVIGESHSHVSASLIDGRLKAIVDLNGKKWGVEPAFLINPDFDSSTYLIYEAENKVYW